VELPSLAIAEKAREKLAGVIEWTKDRWDVLDPFDSDPERVSKAETSPWWALGGMFYFTWILVIASGVYLMLYYIPTTDAAWESIRHIQENVAFGSWARGLHKYGADAMIILATMRVYRMVFTGEYKKPNELNYIVAIVALIVAMYSGLTGYLLIWNQRAFWATKVFATFPTYLDQTPLWIPGAELFNSLNIGKTTAQILVGGTAIGQKTMTNFYALHFAFSGILLILVELRMWRKGWRSQWKRMSISWQSMLAIVAILLLVTAILPAESGSPADPTKTPLPILSDWYFLAMYQMLKYQHPYLATILTMAIPVLAILMVVLDRRPEKGWRQRPFAFTMAMFGLINWIAFSVLIILDIANINRDPPLWYGSWCIAFIVGALWDWWYVAKRDQMKNIWFSWHPYLLGVSVVCMSMNIVGHYYKTTLWTSPAVRGAHFVAMAALFAAWGWYGWTRKRAAAAQAA
jgi:quinol-cytochrome oxidoreductase complex cytochrome b subunit